MAAEVENKTVDLKDALQSGVIGSTGLEFPVSQEARNVLSILDFPTPKTEEWKYTRVGKMIRRQFVTPTFRPIEVKDHAIPELEADCLVFVNGHFDAGSSSIGQSGITGKELAGLKDLPAEIGSLSLHTTRIFETLNTAYPTNGAYIHVPKGEKVEKPMEILHVASGSGQLIQPRHVIIVEDGAELELVFNYTSDNANGCLTNTVIECIVGQNAKLSIDLIQNEEEKNFQIHSTHAHQDRDSRFSIKTLCLNGDFIRNDLNIRSDAANCESTLNGTYIPQNKEHVDNHTVVDHLKAQCNSSELYKGVMNDTATAVFNGKVFVRPDAQKINAFQSNANILLSDDATVNSKPELEIYADDVRCSHGSTTGQLDEDAMFYLRSRGIKKDQARDLLVKAFVGDVLETIEIDAVREHVTSLIEKKLSR